MKKNSLFLALILAANVILAQENEYNPSADPLCNMVTTLYNLETVSFNSKFAIKNVFEQDTAITYGNVILLKKGTTIEHLQIFSDSGDKEMLFCNDSAWLVDHDKMSLIYLGGDIDDMTHHSLSVFIPFELYEIDTIIRQAKPHWSVKRQDRNYVIVSLDSLKANSDVSNIRVEFRIGKNDLLPYGTIQESTYLKADNLYQEQTFSNYGFPAKESILVPEYLYHYTKDMSILEERNNNIVYDANQSDSIIYLEFSDLRDIDGNLYALPDTGLIFLDLWYVGCAPCMKSALIIEKLYHAYKEDIFFTSLNEIDHDRTKISTFKEKMGISFPVLLGEKQDISTQLTGGYAYPIFIIMEAQSHKVLWHQSGYTENLEEIISLKIQEFLHR